jgi:hypothetical protein
VLGVPLSNHGAVCGREPEGLEERDGRQETRVGGDVDKEPELSVCELIDRLEDEVHRRLPPVFRDILREGDANPRQGGDGLDDEHVFLRPRKIRRDDVLGLVDKHPRPVELARAQA